MADRPGGCWFFDELTRLNAYPKKLIFDLCGTYYAFGFDSQCI